MAARRSVADRLDAVVPDFDALIGEARSIRNAAHFDQLESKANAICTAIRGAFRSRDA